MKIMAAMLQSCGFVPPHSVCEINVDLPSLSNKFAITPVPPALLDGFSGSAPLLGLHSIPFPALLNLFLTAINLVYLALVGIPHTGYISPEAIVTGLVFSYY